MRNFAITIFIIFVVIILGLYLISFQVRETQSCLVMTFGKPDRQITEPGWYFKWPFPIQQVARYDSRMSVYSSETEETPTAGGEPIIVNTYVVWKISDPLEYYKATRGISVMDPEEELLRSRIRNTQNNIIGQHYFSEFVNSDPNRINFEKIENDMLEDLQKAVADAQYGIEIKALGIKQLKVSEEVSKKVFERMRTERIRIAEKYRAEGDSKVDQIEQEAQAISDQLLAAAEAMAKRIRGDGDAQAAQYYALLDEDPEFSNLLYALDALQKMFESGTTYVLPADTEPFSLLRNIPKLKPEDPNEIQEIEK